MPDLTCHHEYRISLVSSFSDGFNLLMAGLMALLPFATAGLLLFSGAPLFGCLVIALVGYFIMAAFAPLAAIPIFLFARSALTKVRGVRVTERGLTVSSMVARRELRWEDLEFASRTVSEGKLVLQVHKQKSVTLTNELRDYQRLLNELETKMRPSLNQTRRSSA